MTVLKPRQLANPQWSDQDRIFGGIGFLGA